MRLRWDVLVAIFVGGCCGGLLRYAAIAAWPNAFGAFPWTTLAVNLAGAFVLTVVIVVASQLAPSRYLRPLLGTGFCGALTTFSSVVVDADRLAAHTRAGVAVGYVGATIVGGLACAALGVAAGRALAGSRGGSR